jgi:hypothetical protein
MKKSLSVLAVAAFATAATAASAQWGRQYDPAWPDRTPEWRGDQECWNPRAGHFERVRPGEFQGDLDFGNCRSVGGLYYGAPVYNDRYVGRIYRDGRYYDNRVYDNRAYGDVKEECWNPRAGHFEEVRRGEYQNDLDFRRCRVVRY